MRQHAVADESVADADEHTDLADLARELHTGGNHALRRLLAAHDFEEPHDVGRREEMQADDEVRPLRHRGDLVDIEIGRVGSEDRALLDDPVELAEHVLLDVHVLEHGLDDEIAIGEFL